MKKSMKYFLVTLLATAIVLPLAFAASGESFQGRFFNFKQSINIPSSRTASPQPAYDTSKCYESDDGQDYETKGTTYGKMTKRTVRNTQTKFTDYCKEDVLYEYYCDGNAVKVEEVDCIGEGYFECDEGSCVAEPKSPDLVVSDIIYGYEDVVNDEHPNGADIHGPVVKICNLGKSSVFDELKFKISASKEKEFIVNDLSLGYQECYHSQVVHAYEFGLTTEGLFEDTHVFSAEVDFENMVEELDEENNILEKSIKFPVCGDYSCDEGETYEFCPFDCEDSCKSEFCNEGEVSVYSACVDFDYFTDKVPCLVSCEVDLDTDFDGGDPISLNPVEEDDICSDAVLEEQEMLFDDYLAMQTKVYECLSNYFDYEPFMLSYVFGPESKLSICTDAEGCGCTTGGTAYPGFILHHSLKGFMPYNSDIPTEVGHLIPDEHETTHAFIRQMIHSLPKWFSEGLAVQTNERLQCDTWALEELGYQDEAYECTLKGDSYLAETPFDLQQSTIAGISMGDGFHLNDDFYEQLKNGDLIFSDFNIDQYETGSLWMIGMRLDYSCEEFCIRDIITELVNFEKDSCQSGGDCGVNPFSGGPKEHITNSVIKEKAEEITGEDLSPLFDLLGLEY
jgi:hypothetical protein